MLGVQTVRKSRFYNYANVGATIVTIVTICSFFSFVYASEEKTATPPVLSIIILPTELPLAKNYEADISPDNRLEEGRQALNSLLAEYAKDMPNVRVMDDNEMAGKLIDIRDSRQALARKIGSQTKSDAAMISTIKKFIRRDAAQSRPASVAFGYQLVEVDSGRILCAGLFDETQQPLFDNILSFSRAKSRNFKWISAIELAREGLAEKLEKCIYLKRNKKIN